jgi:hypothetical protein
MFRAIKQAMGALVLGIFNFVVNQKAGWTAVEQPISKSTYRHKRLM